MTGTGKAKCQWSVRSGRHKQTYHGQESFWNEATSFFANGNCGEISEGVYTYNANYQLPIPIPYSAERKHGSIRYKLKAVLSIPWGFDLKDEKRFTVVRYEDLNYFPELRTPIEMEQIKEFCWLFCNSNPLIIRVRLPKSGFGVGETIPLNVLMINKSKTKVLESIIVLRRIDCFNETEPCYKPHKKEVKTSVGQNVLHQVKGGETISFDSSIGIPQNAEVSNDRYCKVFQITYELKIIVKTAGCHRSPKIKLPITIGTVGINDQPQVPIESPSQSLRKNIYYYSFSLSKIHPIAFLYSSFL